jgi:hypothetical protein
MASKRKKVGRPRSGLNEMIAIRWPKWLLDGIDGYGRDHLLERSAALKHIVIKFLASEGRVDPNAMYPENDHEARSAAR